MRAERPAAARSFGEREAARSGRLEPLSLQAWACRGLRSPSVRVEQLTVSHRRAVPKRKNFSVKGVTGHPHCAVAARAEENQGGSLAPGGTSA